MNVIPGMTELIQKEDVGKAMIALLVISYPLEILNIFWNAIENDGGRTIPGILRMKSIGSWMTCA